MVIYETVDKSAPLCTRLGRVLAISANPSWKYWQAVVFMALRGKNLPLFVCQTSIMGNMSACFPRIHTPSIMPKTSKRSILFPWQPILRGILDRGFMDCRWGLLVEARLAGCYQISCYLRNMVGPGILCETNQLGRAATEERWISSARLFSHRCI